MTRSHTYKKYKPSGVAWLGDVPAHWAAQRGKFLFSYQKQVNDGLMVDDRLALTLNGVIERDIEEDAGLQPTDFESYQIFKSDDLVFKLIDLENLQTSRVGYVPKTGIMSPAYIRLSSRGESATKFFYYFYYSLWLRHIFKILGGQGVRSSLNASELLDVVLPLPPIEEQEAIAAYLDEETARIDEIIERKQRQIGLLEDKRRALITHAVTRGLNPKAKMKDSGVPWLGRIPAHWEVKRLRFLVEMNPRKSEVQHYDALTEVQFLPMALVSADGGLDLSDIQFFEDVYSGFTYFRRGDVIVAKITPCFENGKGAYLGDMSCDVGFGSTEFHVARPTSIDGRYLSQIFATGAFRELGKAEMSGAVGQQRVSEEFFKNFEIGIPSLSEQVQNTQHIITETTRIDELKAKIEVSLNLLAEHRAALITAAVTGQIKVA